MFSVVPVCSQVESLCDTVCDAIGQSQVTWHPPPPSLRHTGIPPPTHGCKSDGWPSTERPYSLHCKSCIESSVDNLFNLKCTKV